MRRDLDETDAFLEARELGDLSNPLRELMQHPREVAIVVGLTLGGTIAFYTYTTYMQKFLVNSSGLSKDTSTVISAASLFCYMCLQPVVGAISDVVGRRPVLLSFGVLGTLLTVPILTALEGTKDAWTAFLLIMAALVIVERLHRDQRHRQSRAVPDAGARHRRRLSLRRHGCPVRRLGGVRGLYLKEIGHAQAFYWYVTGCIFVSLTVYALMRDTRRHSAMERRGKR